MFVILITSLLVLARSTESAKRIADEPRSVGGLDPGAFGSPVESPYWEYILREYLFKTISPPPPANNILYKEFLEAPFYTGPFSEVSTEDDSNDGERAQILSRGDVYHLGVNRGWIICQEGCVNCEICTLEKSVTIPTIKWILKRIEKGALQFSSKKKYDQLQLTVLPQNDDTFHMKNLSPGSYVYVTSNNGVLNSFTDTLIKQNEKQNSLRYPFRTTKVPKFNQNHEGVLSPGENHRRVITEVYRTEDEVFPTEPQLQITSTLIPEIQSSSPRSKYSREIVQKRRNQGMKEVNEVSTENSSAVSSNADCGPGNAKLILGEDQFGEKHLVHVVPAGERGEPDDEIRRTSVFPVAQGIYEHPESQNPLEIDQKDRSLYRKIFQRVVESLKTHKNAIEKFLLSPKRDTRLENEKLTFYNYEDFSNSQNLEECKAADETAVSDLIPTSDNNLEKIIINDSRENMSLTLTTIKVSNEEGELLTENHEGTVRVTNEDHLDQKPNIHLQNFGERKLSDESINRKNNAGNFILKEVAKSVVNDSDILQGSNNSSVINNKNPLY